MRSMLLIFYRGRCQRSSLMGQGCLVIALGS